MELVFAFIIGSSIGSFLNVCIYRLVEKKSLIFPGSFCPECKKNIPAWSNIPLLGFILLRGKCYKCSANISFRYPLVELLAGVFTVFSFLHFGLSISFVVYSVFIYFLIVIAFIDIQTHLIYNKVLIVLLIFGLFSQILFTFIPWDEALLGLATGGLTMWLISILGKWMFKKESLGMGDVKLAAVAGFFTGWLNVLIALYLGFILAFIAITLHNKFKKIKITGYIPLGPFLAGGLIVFLFWGDEISKFYITLVT
ncbi:MAG: prepilin peptidase [Calditrichaeota bacterium]|nr:MAG: prepilin peptidase [Calditrichota bacterium]MBL1204369.1 prepilin peptidase [Calditrichota bacterium]NOG44198.1 prepilin peptidase [Calditrichota bacterium]